MIDLHTHTNYSDGTWNLRKLLEEAEKTNIEVLSITCLLYTSDAADE